MATAGNKTAPDGDAGASRWTTSPQRLQELNDAIAALARQIKPAAGAAARRTDRPALPEQAFRQLATLVERIQHESGLAPAPRRVAPPRRVVPRFETTSSGKPPTVVDLGDDGELKMTPQALSLNTHGGALQVHVDEAGGVSVSTPAGGVTVDRDGVAVDAGGAGRVTLGPGGASVSMPGVGTVGVDSEGRITVGPAPEGGLPNPVTPNGVPVPVPRFEVQPIEIPIPIPRFVSERFDVPLPLPHLEPMPLPDLAGVLRRSFDEVAALLRPDPLLAALAQALQIWTPMARMQSIRVEGPLALAGPGCLDGPDLRPFMAAHAAVAGAAGAEQAFAAAVTAGVAESFALWAAQVTVPGLPWYPSFGAYPGAVAPPLPNSPTPLLACVSAQLDAITVPARLEAAIERHLAARSGDAAKARLRILSGQLAAHFSAWLAGKVVMSVMGQGPVPGYAPPHVPAGAVVNGTAEGRPGCIV